MPKTNRKSSSHKAQGKAGTSGIKGPAHPFVYNNRCQLVFSHLLDILPNTIYQEILSMLPPSTAKIMLPYFLKTAREKKISDKKRANKLIVRQRRKERKETQRTVKRNKKVECEILDELAAENEEAPEPFGNEEDLEQIEEMSRNLEEDDETPAEDNVVLKNSYLVFRDEALKYELLTPDQEKELSRRIEAGDQDAFDLFVKSNYRLVIACAKQAYSKRNKTSMLEFMDIIQEGVIGLLIAVRKFDWRYGTRFSTYGVLWIYQRINKIADSQREGFAVPGHAGQCVRHQNEDIRKYLAGELNKKNTPPSRLKRIKELAAITAPVIALDPYSDPDDGAASRSPELVSVSTVKDDSAILDQIQDEANCDRFHQLLAALLTADEYDLLCRRHGMGAYSSTGVTSLKTLAVHCGKSIEYVRLIIEAAEHRLRNSKEMSELMGSWLQKSGVE